MGEISHTLSHRFFYIVNEPTNRRYKIMALINNAEVRFHIIPNLDDVQNPIKLAPGYNEVDNKIWEKSRAHVGDLLEAGFLSEYGATVEEDAKTGKISFKAKAFKDLDPKEAEKIIKGTYYIPQLEAWKDKCAKEEIRLYIIKKIDEVNKAKKTEQEG